MSNRWRGEISTFNKIKFTPKREKTQTALSWSCALLTLRDRRRRNLVLNNLRRATRSAHCCERFAFSLFARSPSACGFVCARNPLARTNFGIQRRWESVYHESQTHSRIIVTRGSVNIWDLLCNDQSLSWRGRRRRRQYFIHLSISRVIILSLLYTLAFYLFSRNYISTINLRAAYLTFIINSRPTSSFLYFFRSLSLSIPIRLCSALVSFCILRRCLLIIPPLEMPGLNSPW